MTTAAEPGPCARRLSGVHTCPLRVGLRQRLALALPIRAGTKKKSNVSELPCSTREPGAGCLFRPVQVRRVPPTPPHASRGLCVSGLSPESGCLTLHLFSCDASSQTTGKQREREEREREERERERRERERGERKREAANFFHRPAGLLGDP